MTFKVLVIPMLTYMPKPPVHNSIRLPLLIQAYRTQPPCHLWSIYCTALITEVEVTYCWFQKSVSRKSVITATTSSRNMLT